MVEGLASVCRDAGSTVADLLGLAGPRAVVVAVAVARILAERRDAAVNAIGMVFPTISVG